MAETYTGEIRNGMVVFDEGTPPLPEGTKVQVEPAEVQAALRDLSAGLRSLAGRAEGLPEDPDHDLPGQPQQLEAERSPDDRRISVLDDRMAPTRAWLLAMAREAEADPEALTLPADLAEQHDHYAHGKPRS